MNWHNCAPENAELRALLAQVQEQLAAALAQIAELENQRRDPPSFVKPNRPAPPASKPPRKRRDPSRNRARRREPPTRTVTHAYDRGLYAKWLFTAITALGWHPFLRINRQGTYCPDGADTFRPLSQVIPTPGGRWKGTVRCFKDTRQLACTLVARWDPGYADPWLVLTDLPPARADVAWYGLRAWIECSDKDVKRGGWHWEKTKMTDPRRAERVWLAMALATLWVVSVGCHAEATHPAPLLSALPETHIARRQAKNGRRPPRGLSCFHRGRLLLVTTLIHGLDLPPMALIPEPWPKTLDTPNAHSPTAPPHQHAA